MSLEQNSVAFLKKVYNEVGYDTNKNEIKYDTNKFVNIVDIAEKIGIKDVDNIQTIVKNLEKKGYLKVSWEFGVTGTSVRITISGINKVEA